MGGRPPGLGAQHISRDDCHPWDVEKRLSKVAGSIIIAGIRSLLRGEQCIEDRGMMQRSRHGLYAGLEGENIED
jgi:hypothetical protein